MSKHIVSGAVALLMVLAPVSASALTPIYVPDLPQNPTILQLQQLIVQLTQILQILLEKQGTIPQPTPPISCPIYNVPLCGPGSHLVGGDMLPNGCQGAPRCVAIDTPVGISSITVTSAVGPLDSDQHYVVNATFTNIPPATVDLVKNDGLGTDVQTFMPITSSRGWDAFYIRPGIQAGSYFLRVHETATGRVVAESAPFYISGSVSPVGQLTVSTDASSPSLAFAPGGATGVTLGVYKLRATGESVNVSKLNVFLSTDNGGSGNPSNIQQLYVYSGSSLIGTGVFAGLGQNATITLSRPLSVARDTDARITIKADLARVGTGQPGVAGSLIKLQLASAEGSGASSGTYIGGSNEEYYGKESAAGVAGVRIVRSFPTVASVPLPSSSGLQDGKLMRFQITANSSGQVSIGRMNFKMSFANLSVTGVQLYGYTDAGYSLPISSNALSNAANRMSETDVTVSPFAGLIIPAGQTYYFELRGSVAATNSTGAAITTTLLGDTTVLPIVAFNALGNSNFAWSGNTYTTSQTSSVDWTNGYAIPGLPASGLVQSRSESGLLPPPPPTSSPRITYSGMSGNTISATYNDMPSNSQVVIINQTSGARIDSVSTYIQNAGSGNIEIPFPPGTPAGTYYLKAMNYSTQAYLAQTVSFTYSGATTCVPPTITMPPVGYSLIISQSGQGQTITATGGAAISISTTYPWATFSGSTLTFTSIPVAGTYPVAFTATNTCGSVSQQFNVIVEAKAPALPTADIKANGSDGPITIAYGATATISWSSSNVSACGIVPSAQAYWVGNYGTSGSKDSGSLTQSNTYTLQCNGNNGQIISDTVTVNVTPQQITIPVPVPTPVATCTYTPGASKLGDKSTIKSSPTSITIEGGQAACSAWCSSQAAEANVYHTCAYNGAVISMSNGASNVTNIAFEGPSMGAVAGISTSVDSAADVRAQLATVLSAIEGILRKIIATNSDRSMR